jgi:hypothetical protein
MPQTQLIATEQRKMRYANRRLRVLAITRDYQ